MNSRRRCRRWRITGGGGFPEATCPTAADAQTLTFSNPGDTPAAWTSSVSPFFGGFSLATLVPSSGTVPPGQSMTVTMVFALVTDPLSMYPIEVAIASGGSTTTLQYFESVAGYDVVAAPATIDFGDLPTSPSSFIDVFDQQNIYATGVEYGGNSSETAFPCQVFNLAQSGSSMFDLASGRACGPAQDQPGANLLFEFFAPSGTPPGMYQATYTFVPGLFGPPYHSPPPIQATANLLPPQDSGP